MSIIERQIFARVRCSRLPCSVFIAVIMGLTATNASSAELFTRDNVLAWCIVPFDNQQRGPAERIAMLERLGISQYAWDWRDEHLASLPDEIRLAEERGIRLRAIWLWFDANQDRVGQLGAGNRTVLDTVGAAGISVEFWLGMHPNVFENLADDAARVRHGAEIVAFLRDEAAKVNGTIALYNHGDWFGEPENEIRIIDAVGDPSVGMVFNFHHAHHMIDDLPRLLPLMAPHLRAVNLNGMRPEGPKILPLASGTHEAAMIRDVIATGFRGPWGVLGHVDDADVENVLRRNLEGLQQLEREIGAP